MKKVILIASAAALMLASVGSADARWKHKRYRVTHHGPTVAQMPDPVFRGRPAWAQPGQCLEDQGYGRYIPCGSAPSVR